jgi:hypothetical protein
LISFSFTIFITSATVFAMQISPSGGFVDWELVSIALGRGLSAEGRKPQQGAWKFSRKHARDRLPRWRRRAVGCRLVAVRNFAPTQSQPVDVNAPVQGRS